MGKAKMFAEIAYWERVGWSAHRPDLHYMQISSHGSLSFMQN